MKMMLIFVGTTVGGAFGWWLGSYVGIMTAFFLSLVGTAVGLYYAKRYSSDFFG